MLKLLFSKNQIIRKIIENGIKYGSSEICLYEKSRFTYNKKDEMMMGWTLGYSVRSKDKADIREAIEILKENNVIYSLKRSKDNCLNEDRIYLFIDSQ